MFNNALLMAAASTAAGGGGFSIDNSVRYNDDDSPGLTRTNSVGPTDASKGIVGGWFKSSNIGMTRTFWTCAGSLFEIDITVGDAMSCNVDGGYQLFASNKLFRDPTAWYQVVCSYDSDESSAGDRFNIYVNGIKITSFSYENFALITAAEAWSFTADTIEVSVGISYNGIREWDGYLAQQFLLDGVSIQNGDHAITDLAEFDDNGVWRPVDLSGFTFGNNGWLLDFADSSALGNDVSGNDNDFTSSGLVAADQFNDTPTNNYCIFNSVNIGTLSGAAPTLSEGGTVLTGPGSTYGSSNCTVGIPTSGKYWFKATLTVAAGGGHLGIVSFGNSGWRNAQCAASQVQSNTFNFDLISCGYFHDVLHRFNGGASVVDVGESSSLSVDDVFEFLIDRDSGDVTINLNGSLHVTVEGLPSTQIMFPFASGYAGSQWTIDCGGNGSTPSDTDFKDINTTNMTTPTILDGTANFQTTLYTGNATDRNISQIENSVFTPDWIWIKNRSAADEHKLIDITRGVGEEISSDSTAAESTNLDGLQAFSDKLWIDASGETKIGNMTSQGGLAASWDGDNSKGYAACSGAVTTGYSGIDWGSGNTKTITQMITIGSNDYGYSSDTETITITIEGSTDNFSSSVVDLGGGTGSFANVTSPLQFKLITPTSTTAYRYHRAKVVTSSGGCYFAQVQFFEDNTGAARGFTLGNGPSGYNDNTETFGAWQWLAGGGAGSSNEAGTINTTTTTVNTTAGISIGTYTGTGSAATIGHGLGVVPKMVIVKERANDVGGWFVYHEGMVATDPEDYYLLLNHYDPSAPVDDATVWNDTAPTSTVFSIGTHDDVNGSTDTFVYYAFADVEGFSLMGSYNGNSNAAGPLVYTGFKPSWILLRGVGRRDGFIYDSQRSPYNEIDDGAFVNEAAAENTTYKVDFLSNGFKIRSTGEFNTDGEITIFAAFAEYPFGGVDVTPSTTF